MISNLSLQKHLQAVVEYAPFEKVELIEFAPVSGHSHTSFCSPSIFQFELLTQGLQFVIPVPASLRLFDEYTVKFEKLKLSFSVYLK